MLFYFLWFVIDDGLMTNTFDEYFYVMRYFVTLAYNCVMIITLSIPYSFRKCSAETSRFYEKG
jgi:hypothetical protein